jgi:hypothetical protein
MQSVEKIESFDFTAGGTYSDNCALQFITSTKKLKRYNILYLNLSFGTVQIHPVAVKSSKRQ